jgi:hypothetical protein
MGASNEDPQPPRDRRLPQPLRLELNPAKRQRRGSNPRVVSRRRPAPQLQVSTHEIMISRTSRSFSHLTRTVHDLSIPGGHGACGHEGHGGEPREFVRREEIAVKVRSLMRGGGAARGARED